jgi:TonB family protein
MKIMARILVVAAAAGLLTATACRADVNREVVALKTVPAPVLGWDCLGKCFLYPQSARMDGVSGVVQVRALILPDGTVGKIRVESGVRADLDLAAQRCLSKTRWIPAQTSEGPVAAWVVIPVHYKLY